MNGSVQRENSQMMRICVCFWSDTSASFKDGQSSCWVMGQQLFFYEEYISLLNCTNMHLWYSQNALADAPRLVHSSLCSLRFVANQEPAGWPSSFSLKCWDQSTFSCFRFSMIWWDRSTGKRRWKRRLKRSRIAHCSKMLSHSSSRPGEWVLNLNVFQPWALWAGAEHTTFRCLLRSFLES